MNRNSAWTSLFLYNDGTLYNERLAMNSLRMRQSELIPCKTCKAEILNWSQLPCGTKFLRVLIFQPAIRKKKAPQKEDKLPQIFLHLYSKYTNTCKKSFLFLFVIVWRRKVIYFTGFIQGTHTVVQWNLDLTKCQGTGEICSLYRTLPFNEFYVCACWIVFVITRISWNRGSIPYILL